MSHPAAPLQKAIFEALSASQPVTDAVGDRIYDHVPEDARFPYVVIGDDSFSRDRWLHECFVTILVFTEGVGLVAAKLLASHVQDALDVELPVEGYITQEWTFEETSFSVEDNDQTQMAEVEFRYLLDPDVE